MFRAAGEVGLEMKRRGEDFDAPKKTKPKPLDPVLAALKAAPEIARLIGAISVDVVPDKETQCWAVAGAGALGPSVSIYTRLGSERANELGRTAAEVLRRAGWRTLGAGPAAVAARGMESGVWAAHLSLARQPQSAPARPRASMAR